MIPLCSWKLSQRSSLWLRHQVKTQARIKVRIMNRILHTSPTNRLRKTSNSHAQLELIDLWQVRSISAWWPPSLSFRTTMQACHTRFKPKIKTRLEFPTCATPISFHLTRSLGSQTASGQNQAEESLLKSLVDSPLTDSLQTSRSKTRVTLRNNKVVHRTNSLFLPLLHQSS